MGKKANRMVRRPDIPKRLDERLSLWDKAFNENDTSALMKQSFMRGIITRRDYKTYLKIKKEFGEKDDR